MSREPFIRRKVIFHMEGADAESTFTSYDGTLYGYDDLTFQVAHKLLVVSKYATEDQKTMNWRTFCRTINDIRETYGAGFKHHRKTFKKILMARGHSPREAEKICKIIGSYKGVLSYRFSDYRYVYAYYLKGEGK